MNPTSLTTTLTSINETNWHLRNLVPHPLCPNHHLHLESITLTLRLTNNPLQHPPLIQPKTPRQITHPRPQHRIRKQIRPPTNQLPLQIPPIHPSIPRIPRPSNDIIIPLFLLCNHLGDEFRVVREIGVHYYHVGPRGVFETVDVGGAETEFAGAGF